MQVKKFWDETRLLYEEELEISLLQRELEQAEHWLSSYENILMAEDYGVGLDQIEEWSKTVATDTRKLRGIS